MAWKEEKQSREKDEKGKEGKREANPRAMELSTHQLLSLEKHLFRLQTSRPLSLTSSMNKLRRQQFASSSHYGR